MSQKVIFLLAAATQAINLHEYAEINSEIAVAEKIEEKEDALDKELETELNDDMSEAEYKNYLMKQ